MTSQPHRSDVPFAGVGLPDATGLGPVTLAAADVGRLESYYRDALGLIRRHDGDGALALGTAEATLLRLVEARDGPRDPAAPGLFHLALLLPDRASLGAWLRHALDGGVALEGAADHAVSEAIYLRDPEGNGIEVYRDRPRASWRTEGGTIVMTTEPLDGDGVLEGAARWRGMPAGARVGHVHLQVGGLSRSLGFFAGTLGWPVTNASFPGARFLAAGGYHHHLGLNHWNVRPAARRVAGAPGLVRFDMVLPTIADVEALERRLAAAGSETRRTDGALEIDDPDGTAVRLLAANAGLGRHDPRDPVPDEPAPDEPAPDDRGSPTS